MRVCFACSPLSCAPAIASVWWQHGAWRGSKHGLKCFEIPLQQPRPRVHSLVWGQGKGLKQTGLQVLLPTAQTSAEPAIPRIASDFSLGVKGPLTAVVTLAWFHLSLGWAVATARVAPRLCRFFAYTVSAIQRQCILQLYCCSSSVCTQPILLGTHRTSRIEASAWH